ncbi:TldD/PmbA family protein [Brevibacillus daliensis]|uniref:TldD/PmbA family protein n=1 Tax=Brevibacillus daliensis TaxID=2892995 RepID=UPI001E62D4B0|nr:TldD/PmbA family protein [Brevibacillus daliensis]
MDVKQFQERLFQEGKELGFTDMEVYYSRSSSTNVSVFKKEIDTYTIKESGGLSFRGVIDGKMCYSFTEKIDENSIKILLEEAKSNAEVLESNEQEELFSGSESYAEVKTYAEELASTSPKELIDAAQLLEQIASEADPRITLVNRVGVSTSEGETMITNTKGLSCHSRYTIASARLQVVSEENGSTTSGYDFAYTTDHFEDLDIPKLAQRAVENALSQLGSASVKSAQYPVILRYDAASDLLATFTSIFSGSAVEKGFSRLAGKLNQQVAGSNITIVDDPLMEGTMGCTSFDAEGMATKKVEVVKNGQLQTFLHNRKTAKKAGVESTGHASKDGYRDSISVAPHNLFIQPGEHSLDEIVSVIDKGLLITDLDGLHSGTSPISGDFSLSCRGFYIEGGKITKPVYQITVSGNMLELLNQVEEIGNDLRFMGRINSPSLRVSSLAISGL